MQYYRFVIIMLIVVCVFGYVHAEDFSINQTSLNLVERIARIEEGQKAIVTEMRARFKAVDERFEMLEKSIEKRFESIEKRFESIDKRFEMMEKNWDKRFESLTRELNQRFENVDKRIDYLVSQNASQANMFFAMFTAIIALFAYVIWDRKTAFNKAFSEATKYFDQIFQSYIEKIGRSEPITTGRSEPIADTKKESTNDCAFSSTTIAEQLIKEGFTIPTSMREKIRDVFDFFNQFPEMRPVLRTA